MSNAEKMISEDLIRAILGNAAQGYFSKDHGDQLRKILDKPAQQHQGEPVAWIEIGDLEKIAQGAKWSGTVWGRPADQEGLYRLPLRVPVYTHADPAEVERLRVYRDDLQRYADELNDERCGFEKKIDTLHAQLAERDALLREVLVGLWPSTPLAIKINAALSASAEPRPFRTPDCPDCACVQDGQCLCSPSKPSAESGAQKDWCSTMERPKSQCGCPDCGSSIVQMGEPNEPVERDERAAFELVIGQKWPGIRMLRINRPGAPADGEYELPGLEAAWQGWQARASLERQP